ncbi:TIGR02449 family protein [Ectothiorhodospiraceae bacterium BW-2]|nr:TIGR02449 family protein [Ectothiorhodospiraceae bacterium BW-2]
MKQNELQHLEQQIDALLKRVRQLKSDNQSLRESQAALLKERTGLIEKTEQARARVETIINRLKEMEAES